MTSELKAFIWNIINCTEEVDKDGKFVRRLTFKAKLFRAVNEINAKLNNSLEVGYEKDGAIVWVPFKEYVPSPGQVIGDRFKEGEVKLSDKEREALRHYYKEREELISVSNETLDQFEALIKE